ncbi:MAG: undecaprenyl-phosphate glucose phosphotransferase [Bacteroidetes bacterium]|nr:MAG: undecaprenyl-phosphate glucose phosphotransferase [Bacteroidota bacterium]
MHRKSLLLIQWLLVGLDVLSLNVVFCSACYHFQQQFVKGLTFYYASFMFYLNIAWLCIALVAGQYKEKSIAFFEIFARRSLRAYLLFVLFGLMYLFFSKQVYISRLFTIVVLLSFALALAFNRFLYIFICNYYKKTGSVLDKIVIVGYNEVSKKLAAYLEKDLLSKCIVGFCDSPENVKELSNYPILGNVDEVVSLCKLYGVAEIYSTIAPRQNPKIYRLIKDADFNCIRFKVVPDLNQFISRLGQIDFLGDLPVISLRHEPLEDTGNRIKKRLFDLVFSSVVTLFLLSWLFPLIAIFIKLSSKGPVFFVQKRAGRNNKVFNVLKFRTLKCQRGVESFKQVSKHDNRVFKFGRFLRRTSMDEMPQFLNVLAGQMSVCGPRPHPFQLNDAYKTVVDKYMVRQFLKPGITGWAQVNGFRGETENKMKMAKRIEADLWYLENWSFWLDVKIIFLTIFNMVKGEENAF